jgi:hypothetical protein
MPTSRAAGHSRHKLEIDPLRDRASGKIGRVAAT